MAEMRWFWLSMGCFLAAANAASPPEVGVVITPLIAVDIQPSDQADAWESWTWLRASAKQRMDRGRWFLGINADHNVRSGQDIEAIWRVSAGESGWAGQAGKTHLRVGNLIERWGKLDLLSSLDVLNPKDLRAGPLGNIETARVPIPMAVWQVGTDTIRAEFSYAPFPEGDHIQMVGSDWSVVKPGMMEGFIGSMSKLDGPASTLLAAPIAQLSEALGKLDPSAQRAFADAAKQMGAPEQFGINGNVGARFEAEAQGVDAAVMVANLRSPIPITRLGPNYRLVIQNKRLPGLDQLATLGAEAPITTDWPRSWMAGTELSSVAGPFGLRAEAVWWSNKVHAQRWLDATAVPSTGTGLAIDYTQSGRFYMAIEGRWEHMLSPVDGPFLTKADVFELGTTARISLANDRLELLAAALVNLSFGDWMSRPEVRWVATDSLSMGLGAVLLFSSTPPPADLSAALSYGGGPISMMGDNDAIFFNLRWSQ
jgi:hypothetical protein